MVRTSDGLVELRRAPYLDQQESKGSLLVVETILAVAAIGTAAGAVARPLFRYLTVRVLVRAAPKKDVAAIAESALPQFRALENGHRAAARRRGVEQVPSDQADVEQQ